MIDTPVLSTSMVRRYVAEFIGTFALLFFGCGTRDWVGDVPVTEPAGVLVVHIAFGFTIAIMIYTLTYISSAHFNPAITFGFALSRHFRWKYVIPYWLAQFCGAILAIFIHFIIIHDKAVAAHFGGTKPQSGIGPSLVLEIILTFFLMLMSMAAATDKRFRRSDSGLTVGFTVLLSGLVGNFISGGSMNPARSLAPALFAGGEALANLWIYFVGPALGAAIAVLIYELIRGNKEHSKDVLEEMPNIDEVLSNMKYDPQEESLQDAVKHMH